MRPEWWPPPLASALLAYRALYCSFLFLASIVTAIEYARLGNDAVVALACVEMVGALLFLLRRSQRIGAIALALVFATAFAGDIANGAMPARFLYYLGTLAFILYLDGEARRNAPAT